MTGWQLQYPWVLPGGLLLMVLLYLLRRRNDEALSAGSTGLAGGGRQPGRLARLWRTDSLL